jgi:multicomponent Na+:H+ antiporter subunit D
MLDAILSPIVSAMPQVPPAFVFMMAAALMAFVPQGVGRSLILLSAPILSALQIYGYGTVSPLGGNHMPMEFMGLTLELMRVDKLAIIFGYIFSLAAFLASIYAWHVKDTPQQFATLLYAGSAIGAVFAGDLVTLFVYWEGTAIASVFLIWARRTEGAYHTGQRYLIVQIASGVILLAGCVLMYRDTGSIAFDKMTLGSLGTWLIFLAFGIKCAFPLLHNWLQDSYPAATITGTVILSSFTTKLAVYALARGFPGTEILIYIGATMTLFPIFFAVIENDLRRVLAYSLNNQLGFMVVGIGIGTELSLNGTAAHAFCHILYKSLLFMSVGAVMFRTGTAKGSELGGLYKTMPYTMLFCVIGAASISAFPLFSGFISKSLIVTASAENHNWLVWGILVFASAGVFHHSGIKIPYFAFFAHDNFAHNGGKNRPKEAPFHMLLAMGITATLCILIGVFPEPLYALLPYSVDYVPYTTAHVITQLQLLMFSALAFGVLMRTGIYPPELKSTNLDTDWFYRKFLVSLIKWIRKRVKLIFFMGSLLVTIILQKSIKRLYSWYGPEGHVARVWPTGSMVIWIAILLAATLIVSFLKV